MFFDLFVLFVVFDRFIIPGRSGASRSVRVVRSVSEGDRLANEDHEEDEREDHHDRPHAQVMRGRSDPSSRVPADGEGDDEAPTPPMRLMAAVRLGFRRTRGRGVKSGIRALTGERHSMMRLKQIVKAIMSFSDQGPQDREKENGEAEYPIMIHGIRRPWRVYVRSLRRRPAVGKMMRKCCRSS